MTPSETRPPRRIYRHRPMVWAGPLLALPVLAMAVSCALDEDFYARDRVLVPVVLMGMCIPLLWVSWWPRTAIEPGGLRVYGYGRARVIDWAEIEGVEVARPRFSSGDGIVITVAGKRIACAVPGVGWYGNGRWYVREAFEDITAAWTTATGRTERAIETLP